MKCFGTAEPRAIVLEILRKGEVQVGEKERASHQESAIKEIAQIVADKTLNPETKKPYTRTIIEKAMVDIHYSVHPTKNAKQQVGPSPFPLFSILFREKWQIIDLLGNWRESEDILAVLILS